MARTRNTYSADEVHKMVATAKQRIAAGETYFAVAENMKIPSTTLYTWLRRDGVLLGRSKPPGLAKRSLVTKDDPIPGLVMIGVDLKTFVRDHRERIIKELCLGKREAIKTAVEEMLRL